MMDKLSANIIGGGIGGLYAGALLAKHGFEVNVFEAKAKIGGYATSWRRGDFLFDSSLHEINGFYPDDKKLRSFRLLNLFERIRLVKIPSPYTSVFSDFEFKVPHNCDLFVEKLVKEFPSEEKGIVKVFEIIKRLSVESCLFMCEKSRQEAVKNTPVKYRSLMTNMFNTVHSLVWKKIRAPRLRTIIAQLYLYYSDDVRKLNLLYFSSPTYGYLNRSYWISGTSSSLSGALCDIIRENGGSVSTGKNVTGVLFKDGKSAGVEVNGSEEYYSDVTVCSGPLKHMVKDVIGYKNIPLMQRIIASRTVPSMSVFSIYLGMKLDIRKIGFEDYCYIINGIDDLGCIDLKKDPGNYADRPIVIVGFNLDNSLCPEGKTVVNISLTDRIGYWNRFRADKQAYKTEKERIAKIILSRVEKRFPGFSANIEEMEIGTPVTMEKYTGNPEGAVYGACQRVSQSNLFRFPNEIKKRNLYFTGAWVNPGGGLSGVIISAVNAVESILNTYGIENRMDDHILPKPDMNEDYC
jgi:all-trans-retinol 13,14-reductase